MVARRSNNIEQLKEVTGDSLMFNGLQALEIQQDTFDWFVAGLNIVSSLALPTEFQRLNG